MNKYRTKFITIDENASMMQLFKFKETKSKVGKRFIPVMISESISSGYMLSPSEVDPKFVEFADLFMKEYAIASQIPLRMLRGR